MNFKQAQQKIRLYRKINSHSHSFRQKDYDNYYEIYPFEDLESVQDIISEYENIKVLNVIKLEDESVILYAANYYDKYLVEKVENGFKLHFEFNDGLFYELIHFFREDIERSIELFKREFYLYDIGNDSFKIPYSVYQEFFLHLKDESIKEAIKFLNRARTSTIVSDYDHISTTISIGRINQYLTYSQRYNY